MSNHSYLLDTMDALHREKARLVRQAEVFSKLEFIEFKQNQLCFERILDLGCGNGAYLSLIGAEFGASKVLGYERNPDLIRQGQDSFPEVDFFAGDLLDFETLRACLVGFRPTLVLMRFVLQHLNPQQRAGILRTISETLPEGANLLIVEVEDAKIRCNRFHPALHGAIRRVGELQSERGGDRNVGALVWEEGRAMGLRAVLARDVLVSNSSLDPSEFIPIVTKIWRSARTPDERERINAEVDAIESWLLINCNHQEFEFSFPIRVFIFQGME